jgi:hypothetical protein
LWRNDVFTDTSIAHHNDPAWFGTRASWRAFRCTYGSFNKSRRVAAIANSAFFAKIFLTNTFFYGEGRAKFPKKPVQPEIFR